MKGLWFDRRLHLRRDLPLPWPREGESLIEVAMAGICATVDRRPGRRFDYVIECTGDPGGAVEALDLVRPRGTIVLKTTTRDEPAFPLSRLVIDEVTLVGSRCGPFPRAVSALGEDSDLVGDLVSGIYPLEKWEEAFEAAGRKDSLKILISIQGGSG